MLIIRLQRVGKKNEPTFRIVLTDSKNGPKSGKFLEILGSYDARDKNESKVDADKVKYWISQGAQISDTVRNFLITQKIIGGKKVNVLPRKTPIVKESEGGESEPKTETAPPDKESPKPTEPVVLKSTEETEEASKVEEKVEPPEEPTKTFTPETPEVEEAPKEDLKEESPAKTEEKSE